MQISVLMCEFKTFVTYKETMSDTYLGDCRPRPHCNEARPKPWGCLASEQASEARALRALGKAACVPGPLSGSRRCCCRAPLCCCVNHHA